MLERKSIHSGGIPGQVGNVFGKHLYTKGKAGFVLGNKLYKNARWRPQHQHCPQKGSQNIVISVLVYLPKCERGIVRNLVVTWRHKKTCQYIIFQKNNTAEFTKIFI